VFIGVAGSRSSAAALAGDLTQAISLGSSVVKNMNRFILEEATVESSGKTLLKGPDGA
jgi:zona occludens toxin (predicted ATPase)